MLGLLSVIYGVTLFVTGCSTDKGVGPAPRSPTSTLGTINVTPLNSIIAVGGTLQIDVSGKSISGDPITAFDSVLYLPLSVNDSLRIHISPTGLITGLSSSGTNPVRLNVFVFKDGLVRASQAIIQVTDVPLANPTLSIQPGPGDSTRLAIGNYASITPMVKDGVTNQVVDNAQFIMTYGGEQAAFMACYKPSFPALGKFSQIQLSMSDCAGQIDVNQIKTNGRSGTVWVIADASVYGHQLRDSVLYTLTNPNTASVYAFPDNLGIGGPGTFWSTVYVSPGGIVSFQSGFPPELGGSISFTFDDPPQATAADTPSTTGGSTGNVVGLLGNESSDRKFLNPGTYHYTVTINGSVAPFTGATAQGNIVVE